MMILRSLLGIAVLTAVLWLFSSNKRKVNWAMVGKGLLLQFVLALAVLKVPGVSWAFEKFSLVAVTLLDFTREGSTFLFGSLITETDNFGYLFAFQVLPTVIFFSAVTSLLYYYGILQRVVKAMAWVMQKTLKLSGAESLAAAGNIFIGQTEAPLLVKPYIAGMSRSELLSLMSGGMATIAGGVLAAYIGYLGGDTQEGQLFFAKHLLTASVLSAPAALISAKILLPETEDVIEVAEISSADMGSNALDAISNGTTEGVKLAVNVGAMLLVFTAIVYGANYIFVEGVGSWTGLNAWAAEVTNGRYDSFSLQFIMGALLSPIAWILGVPPADLMLVGQLLGEKTILNEFYAYVSLTEMKNEGLFTSERSVILSTYMLCGFANIASIGIQIGGIGVLAPSRRKDLSELSIKALIAGTVASLYTAAIVGLMI
ncbi:MAG: Na+ dependent nucleoside transporter [Flavobacteriales bacterium]|jgi:CNT family concentrative nucleoside transporter|nr:Na+ dependent nucleoside transporter [Flavobacteriales bacterium]MDP4616659.1 Na+ dependent nucleoside transporter [Schleiferiaceae bacterium]MDP4759593.1 Na+ dependent nucleoside transporter [Schleiferiaceae bacterium]MDP4767353.1 Na+ dependent nucleoside transporter [Schleiferiaceae bacterium]MDP4877605.1 Na+ dependent nucleoside transporter [Schleiferiaceae bacterium]